MKEKGQVILLLILIMTVALAIGLSIVQKSLVDVSTASKVEQSSRAFSAAEAGVEKGLRGDTTRQTFTDTSSQITSIENKLTPCVPGTAGCAQVLGQQQIALEFPPLAKEDVAQVWLSDPTSTLPNCDSGKVCYTQNTLDVYWGSSSTDRAALEATLVYYGTDPTDPDTSQRNVEKYRSRKWYLDHSSAIRNPANGFDTVSCPGTYEFGANKYQCKKTIGDNSGLNNGPLPTTSPNMLMLLRMRLLYNSTSQPFALQPPPTAACGAACSLPSQARSITSTGVSGETQRKVKVFLLDKVVPHYFDYALFSAGEIKKSDN